jgi:hypothetical protein
MTTRSKSAPYPAAKPPKAPAFTSPRALADALGVTLQPLPKPNEVQRLRKPLPGYAASLDDVADLLEHDADALGFRDLTPDHLLDLQRRHAALRRNEVLLETVYQSVYYQRLRLDDEAMGLLQRIARRVQSRAEEDPQMPLRWGTLLDFLGAFRKGGRTAAPAPAPAEAPTAEGGNETL